MDWASSTGAGKWARGWSSSFLATSLLLLVGLPLRLGAQAPVPATTTSSPSDSSSSIQKLGEPTGTAGAGTPLATLHVYTNLMQVPVLVLSSDHQRLNSIQESKFRISLDNGPLFKPTHVRREGEDPIELAILIDTSRRDNELLPGIAEAMAALVPGSLRPWDHVSVYVMDCGVVRTALDQPADAVKLRDTIDRGMVGWQDRRHQKHPSGCKSTLQLFDAMAFVSGDLMRLPGRRALLVLSDGMDHGSQNNWNRLMRFDQSHSIAVFGLRSRQELDDEHLGGFDYRQNRLAARLERANVHPEDQFDMICQLTGGVQLVVSDYGLKKGLVRFIAMLRERYIVEYPRSNTATGGVHDLLVTVPDALAYVRPAGISVPLADQKLLANPMTLPSQAEVPVEGPRRVLAVPEPPPPPQR